MDFVGATAIVDFLAWRVEIASREFQSVIASGATIDEVGKEYFFRSLEPTRSPCLDECEPPTLDDWVGWLTVRESGSRGPGILFSSDHEHDWNILEPLPECASS